MKRVSRLAKEPEPVAALVARWRAEAVLLRRRGAPVQADVLESAAVELESVLALAQEATVSLREAASLSGYTPDALTRLVRRGALENVGRPRAPKFRVADLPRKVLELRRSLGSRSVVDARQGTGSVTEKESN